VEKAKASKTFYFIVLRSVPPAGVAFSSGHCHGTSGRESGVFPLYEVGDGKYKVSSEMPKKLKPVKDYFKAQGRSVIWAKQKFKKFRKR